MIADLVRETLERGGRVFQAGLDAHSGATDLDHELIEPGAERVKEVLVLAGSPADLRRIATLHKLLPEAERVVVAVADTPAAHPAPVPTPTPAHRWRSLTELRVYQPKNRVWVVDARFSAPTPAGRTVAATARAFAGHRLDVIAAPAAAIAGVGAADWRPGDPNATPAELTGPVPDRVGAPGGDIVLRTVEDDVEWAEDEQPVDRPTVEAASWERIGRPGGTELAAVPVEPSMIPPVDERLVNPMGFVTTPSRGMAMLAESGGRWSVVLDGRARSSRSPPRAGSRTPTWPGSGRSGAWRSTGATPTAARCPRSGCWRDWRPRACRWWPRRCRAGPGRWATGCRPC
ncbi:hypothetical protein [Nonomuraea dietziae]|uniref:hypothetical protein n=1 Tax=Nonomuraea dietziae TaxID=65515 RepID=UPI0031E09BB9